MPVTGLVGLPGSGKTLRAVELALRAREDKRDVYANFRLGSRRRAYLLPRCADFADRDVPCWDFAQSASAWYRHAGHVPNGYFLAPASDLDRTTRRMYDAAAFRSGRAFVADPGAVVLTSWQQVLAIRDSRDAFDKPHRLKLVLAGVADDGTEEWAALPTCDVVTCTGCSHGITIVLDELNLWAPSRLWQLLGVGVLNRWAYVRKDGLEIIWTAQHEGRVDVVARQVTDFIWSCHSFGPIRIGPIRLQLFNRRRFIPATMTEANRTGETEGAKAAGAMGMDFEWSFFSQRIADGYDTYEHVGAIAVKKQKAPRRAPAPGSLRPARGKARPAASSAGTPVGAGSSSSRPRP